MLKLNFSLTLLVAFNFLAGCSGLIRKTALRTSAELLQEAAENVTSETDWNYFKESAPGSLKMMEGFLSLDPTNSSLLKTLARAHAGYAYGVSEMLFLKSELTLSEAATEKKAALLHYSRALSYALSYLEKYKVSWDGLLQASKKEGVNAYLKEHLQKTDQVEVILTLAQSLGGLINGNKSNPHMLVHLPLMKDLFDFGCKLIPDYDQGMCDLFFALYEANRPALIGGSSAKAKNFFLTGMKKFPQNYLLRVNYLQFYCVSQMDEKCYQEQKELIHYAQKEFESKKYWNPSPKNEPSSLFTDPKLNLFNAIAFKRFEIIRSVEKTFF